MNNDEIIFSSHALSQFSVRTHSNVLDTLLNIRNVWECAEKIDREEAYRIIKYKKFLSEENKKTIYYKVNLGCEEVLDIIEQEGCHLNYNKMIGIFVVKDNKCVTFKTNIESGIWKKIRKNKYKYGFNCTH